MAKSATSWIASVRAATLGNITLSGLQTVDGVSLAANDRVLVKNQSTTSQNGVYDVAPGAWTRSSDFATGTASVTAELEVRISEGATQAHTAWYLATSGVVNVGTTGLTFVALNGPLHVRDFGAIGDNSTDDTDAIKAALQAAAAQGKLLVFDPLSYKVCYGLTFASQIDGRQAKLNAVPYAAWQGNHSYAVGDRCKRVVPAWLASVVYAAGDRRFNKGLGFECITAGRSASSDGPNCLRDVIDGLADNPWLPRSNHGIGDMVTNGDKTYICVADGKTGGGGGPTGTGTSIADGTILWNFLSYKPADIVDGTVHWRYIDAVGETLAHAYECIAAGTSLASGPGPTSTAADITDGTAHWKYLGTASDALVTVDALPAVGFLDVSNINLYAAHEYNYVARLTSVGGASQGRWTRVKFYQGLIDGCHLDPGAGDSIIFDLCRFEFNGQIFRSPSSPTPSMCLRVDLTGCTATTTAGSRTVALSGGSPKLLSRGIRPGDHIAVGVNSTQEWLQILSVDSDTQLTTCFNMPSSYTRSGQEFQIGVGAGYYEQTSKESNVNKHFGCLYRSSAGPGMRFDALYGPVVIGAQADFVGSFGVVIGTQGRTSVNGSNFLRTYVEDLGAPSAFFVGGCAGLKIDGLQTATAAVTFGNPSYVTGCLVEGNYLHAGVVTSAGDPMVSELWGRTLYRGTIRGTTALKVTDFNVSSFSSPIDIGDTAFLAVGSGGSGVMSGTPTLSAGTTDGQILRLMYTGTYSLTLKDEVASGAATALQLRTPRVTLKQYDSIDFIWVDCKWREVARSVSLDVGDTSATPGSATSDTFAGKAAVALGATTVTITSDKCTARSVVHVTIQDVNATATRCAVAAGAGSFTVTFDAAPTTAACRFVWSIER
ncbi:hypothetical protein P2318_13750 [Myxococcaceae bacterium GXIMD 01537]